MVSALGRGRVGGTGGNGTPACWRFLFGDNPTIADICLVPQLYNARRFSVPITDYPTLRRADEKAQRPCGLRRRSP